LDGIKISWVRGEEPAVLEWLRTMGKLGRPPGAFDSREEKKSSTTSKKGTSHQTEEGTEADLPQKNPFSSFPSSFHEDLPSQTAKASQAAVPGLDYEALTLMRLRQAERERLEKEILEQEAGGA